MVYNGMMGDGVCMNVHTNICWDGMVYNGMMGNGVCMNVRTNMCVLLFMCVTTAFGIGNYLGPGG